MAPKVGPSISPTVYAPDQGPAAPMSPDPAPSGDVRDSFGPILANLGLPTLNPSGQPLASDPSGTVRPADAASTQAADDARRLTQIRDLLGHSTTGTAALQYMDSHHIPVTFANGGGSYWDGSKIVIDRTRPMDRNALSLVHEMNHAKASIEGTSANIRTQSRGDYVNTMLNEEVTGTVRSIQAKNELVASGQTVASTYPLEAEYNAASRAATDALRARNPRATPAELRAAGDQAGFDRVMQGFRNGEVSTSTTGVNYPDYYGNAWDAAHPRPAH